MSLSAVVPMLVEGQDPVGVALAVEPNTPIHFVAALAPAVCEEWLSFVRDRPAGVIPAMEELAAQLVDEANASTWRLPGLTRSPAVVLEYGRGQSQPWHCDGSLDASRRWLGLILALSDPDAYEGGELQIGWDGTPRKLEQGSAVVLPGGLPHRVLSVTGGERRTVVAFAWGLT